MPARLLAYGGTGYIERRRIGQWPPVPEATLRDTYGLSANTWSYGLGILANQPFLMFRCRQNIESRGGYPFTVLLDPGDAVWQRFEWNGAAIIASIIDANPDQLFRTPESCSSDALDRLTQALNLPAASEPASDLCEPIVGSTMASDPVVLSQPRPDATALAAALSTIPVCFRTGRGWLIGGGGAHGRALGANLVIDEQAATDGAANRQVGRVLMEAWVAERPLVQKLEVEPMWTWEQHPVDVLNSVMLLREVESAPSPSDELIERVQQAAAFRAEIERATGDLLTRGSAPIGPKASLLLIQLALQDKRKLDSTISSRLHDRTLRWELKKASIPPKKPPKALPISRDLHTTLWVDYLETLPTDIRKNLAEAFDQLGPEAHAALVASAINALPSSDEKLIDWARFRKDPQVWSLLAGPLRKETLRRFTRNGKGAVEAYLLLADDPGGALASEELPLDEDANRLVTEIRALETPEAHAWLTALKSSPLRNRLPKPAPRRRSTVLAKPEPPSPPPPPIEAELRELLFESDPDSVESRATRLSGLTTNGPREELDQMVFEQSQLAGHRFAQAFHDKYTALGNAFRFLSDASQDRLLDCLGEEYFKQFAARDISHALNNKPSRNAYTRALSRRLITDRQLRKQVAADLALLPDDLQNKLSAMLKDGRR